MLDIRQNYIISKSKSSFLSSN